MRRLGEAPQHDRRAGRSGAAHRGEQPLPVPGRRAVEDVGQREAVEGPRCAGLEISGGIAADQRDPRRVEWRGWRHVAPEQRASVAVAAVGVSREAALESPAHHAAEARRQDREERRRVHRLQPRDRQQRVGGKAKARGVEVSAPVGHLRRRLVEFEEAFNDRAPPAEQRHRAAAQPHHALGRAGDGRPAPESRMRVVELHRIDVDRRHVEGGRQRHRRVAGGGDGEHARARRERRALDADVLVHLSEQHLARPAAGVEAAGLPGGRIVHAEPPAARSAAAAVTHASTRNAAFLITMPVGSGIRWREK